MTTVSGSYIYNANCDVCDRTFKSNELKKRWDGLIVCGDDWETRHPSDFLKVRNDTHKLPFIRDEVFKMRAKASITADVTPVGGAWTLLAFNEELADQASEFNTGTSVFQPSVTESRTFSFRYTLSQTGGQSSMEIALYKNGAPLKVYPAIYLQGSGEAQIGGMYIDSTATNADQYTVRYRITTTNGVIKAYDNGTYFEIN